jgi:lipopolysaccharide export LptBFGC system permease protein LptF
MLMAEYIPAIAVYLCAALVIFAIGEELSGERVITAIIALAWPPVFAVLLAIKLAAMLRGGDADG